MSCEACREAMLTLSSEEIEALDHLASCAECRALAEEFLALDAGLLDELADFESGGDFEASWAVAVAEDAPPSRQGSGWARGGVALLLAALLLFGLMPRVGPPDPIVPDPRPVAPTVVPALAPPAADPSPDPEPEPEPAMVRPPSPRPRGRPRPRPAPAPAPAYAPDPSPEPAEVGTVEVRVPEDHPAERATLTCGGTRQTQPLRDGFARFTSVPEGACELRIDGLPTVQTAAFERHRYVDGVWR